MELRRKNLEEMSLEELRALEEEILRSLDERGRVIEEGLCRMLKELEELKEMIEQIKREYGITGDLFEEIERIAKEV